MVKIIQRRALPPQSVYDLGVVRDHNFLLANGSVASNCFNKSHSTAYAYVTYQTAYLKANYPVEYMAALLTSNSSNKDKIESYINTCQRMGIKIEPPDINRSEIDFTPDGEAILFGLSAVPSLGDGAIESILQAREKAGGAFSSFADFCYQVDNRVVNRRSLETLIKCGAFTAFSTNRNQLIESIDTMLAWAQQRTKERDSGQMNLFGQLTGGETHQFDAAPSLPDVPDLPAAEKLKMEKELLGFYISEHPLDSMRPAVKLMEPVNLADLSNYNKRTPLSAIAVVNTIRVINTKKGDRMAFLGLEDRSGEAEGVIFPRTFELIEALIQEDMTFIFWGKADRRDDKVAQFLIEDAEPVEAAQMILVELTPQQATNAQAHTTLCSILNSHSGGDKKQAKVPIVAAISNGQDRKFIRLNRQFWVQSPQPAIADLQKHHYQAQAQPLIPQRQASGRPTPTPQTL